MSGIEEKLRQIEELANAEIGRAEKLDRLNDIRVSFLGKKGTLTQVLKSMKDVPPEERPQVGKWVNDTRARIEEQMEIYRARLEEEGLARRLREEEIDVTLPAKKPARGHRHPNTIALEEVERIFVGMGYEVLEGPEIEYDE